MMTAELLFFLGQLLNFVSAQWALQVSRESFPFSRQSGNKLAQ
jgi:hypothetical protein